MSKHPKEKTMSVDSKANLAEILLSMSYGDTIRLCDSILAIQRRRAVDTSEELAAILYEWANAQ
jgi:hypothetical protein